MQINTKPQVSIDRPVVDEGRVGPQYTQTFIEYTVSSGLIFSEDGFEVYHFDTDSYFEILFTYIESCVTHGEIIDLGLNDPELQVTRVRLNLGSEDLASLNAASIMLAINSTEPIGNPAHFLQRKLSTSQSQGACSRRGSIDSLCALGEDGLARDFSTDDENVPTPPRRVRLTSLQTMSPKTPNRLSARRGSEPIIQVNRNQSAPLHIHGEVPELEQSADLSVDNNVLLRDLSDAGSLSCKLNEDTESEMDSEYGSQPTTPNMAQMVNSPNKPKGPGSLRKSLLRKLSNPFARENEYLESNGK